MTAECELDPRFVAHLKQDFPDFAEKYLRIRVKLANEAGEKLLPLVLNREQRYLNAKADDQLRRTGRVRMLILKGRQQGCSTWVGGRFFHRTRSHKGTKTFILTHRDDATDNLFKMVKRFFDNLPGWLQPSTSYSSRKELVFDKLDSAYALGTAGGGGVGRSDTIDLFHGSEVAFWKNAADIRAGVLQAAECAQEIILESTANGHDPMFHTMWQDAEAGNGDYEAVFIPWFWRDEYRRAVPPGFVLTAEDEEYRDAYGLDMEQMAWRRNKIETDLKDPLLFKQEYPATAAEAFQVTGHDAFISVDSILRARKPSKQPYKPIGPRVVGLDPAREGDDRAMLVNRQGRVAWGLERIASGDTMHIVGRCRQLLEERGNPVDMLFIDRGGEGAGIYDRLAELGYGDRVRLVNFGSVKTLLDPKRFVNKRAEMWGLMRDWLDDDAGVEIPDSDELQADLLAPGYKFDSLQRILLERKEDIKKRGLRSPDAGDALALTFAFPVAPKLLEKPRAKTDYDVLAYGSAARRPEQFVRQEYNPATYGG